MLFCKEHGSGSSPGSGFLQDGNGKVGGTSKPHSYTLG